MAAIFFEERQSLLDHVRQAQSWDSLLPLLRCFPTRDDPCNAFERVQEVVLEVLAQKLSHPTVRKIIITHAPFRVIPQGVLIKTFQILGNFPDLLACMMTCVELRDIISNPHFDCFGGLNCIVVRRSLPGPAFRWNKETMTVEMTCGPLTSLTRSHKHQKREAWFFKYIVPSVRKLEVTSEFFSLEPEQLELFVARMKFFHSQHDNNTDAFDVQHGITAIVPKGFGSEKLRLESCYERLRQMAAHSNDPANPPEEPLDSSFRFGFVRVDRAYFSAFDIIHSIAIKSRLARLNLVSRREEIAQFLAFPSRWNMLLEIVMMTLSEDFGNKNDFISSTLTTMIHVLASQPPTPNLLQTFFRTVAQITTDDQILENIAHQIILNIDIMKQGGHTTVYTEKNFETTAAIGYRILFAFVVSLVDDDRQEIIDDLIQYHNAWQILWSGGVDQRDRYYIAWAASNLALGSPIQQDHFGRDGAKVIQRVEVFVTSAISCSSETKLVDQLGVFMRNFALALDFGGFDVSSSAVLLCSRIFNLCLQVYEKTGAQENVYGAEACIVAFHDMVHNEKLSLSSKFCLGCEIKKNRRHLETFSSQKDCSEEAKKMVQTLLMVV